MSDVEEMTGDAGEEPEVGAEAEMSEAPCDSCGSEDIVRPFRLVFKFDDGGIREVGPRIWLCWKCFFGIDGIVDMRTVDNREMTE